MSSKNNDKIERSKIVLKILNKTYPQIKVPLKSRNVFTLLISVLLSAQCTDERVNQITPKLFSIASSPLEMSKIPVNEIYKVIKPCGLGPQKSKAIHKLSNILVKKYDQKIPDNFKDLESLPGVGHKTASVVMSQGFGIPAFAVDTHIHRLAQRWGLTKGKNVKKTEEDLKKIFPKNSWNKLHLQIIFWGREHCMAKACFGLECEICKKCYPKRKKPFVHNKP